MTLAVSVWSAVTDFAGTSAVPRRIATLAASSYSTRAALLVRVPSLRVTSPTRVVVC